MTDTWIVVADGAHARIFASDAEMADFTPVKELKNHHHAPQHRRHPAAGHDGAHHHEEAKFAADVATEIGRAVQAHEVRDVVLVAPARFMGDLTTALPKPVAGHVTGKVQKDYAALERHELAKRVREALAENHERH